jgi:DNA-binding GntR family transcriptional regulator
MMDLLLNSLMAVGANVEHSRNAPVDHVHIIAALKEGNFDRLSLVIKEHFRGAGERPMPIVKKSPLLGSNFSKSKVFSGMEE